MGFQLWGSSSLSRVMECAVMREIKRVQPEPRDISWGISSVGNTELPQFRLTRFCRVI
jgi:hypothetical protein